MNFSSLFLLRLYICPIFLICLWLLLCINLFGFGFVVLDSKFVFKISATPVLPLVLSVSPADGEESFCSARKVSLSPPARQLSLAACQLALLSSIPIPATPPFLPFFLLIGRMPTPETSEECVVCSSSGPCTVSCRQCSRLLYCSDKCQMKDSGSSLHTCLPYSVLYEPRCGRLLIAARDISAGEVRNNQSRTKLI